jgi:hypothetical protein
VGLDVLPLFHTRLFSAVLLDARLLHTRLLHAMFDARCFIARLLAEHARLRRHDARLGTRLRARLVTLCLHRL